MDNNTVSTELLSFKDNSIPKEIRQKRFKRSNKTKVTIIKPEQSVAPIKLRGYEDREPIDGWIIAWVPFWMIHTNEMQPSGRKKESTIQKLSKSIYENKLQNLPTLKRLANGEFIPTDGHRRIAAEMRNQKQGIVCVINTNDPLISVKDRFLIANNPDVISRFTQYDWIEIYLKDPTAKIHGSVQSKILNVVGSLGVDYLNEMMKKKISLSTVVMSLKICKELELKNSNQKKTFILWAKSKGGSTLMKYFKLLQKHETTGGYTIETIKKAFKNKEELKFELL